MKWYFKCWQQYADFSGRARRKEYWMFCLYNAIAGFILGFISGLMGGDGLMFLSSIYSLAVFIPGLAVCVRRLHDTGRSGWWCLLAFIPIIGTIWLIILLCIDSQAGCNQWGNNPKETEMI